MKITLLICFLSASWLMAPAHAQRRKDRDKQEVKEEGVLTRLEGESMATEGMKFMMKDEPDRALPVFEKLALLIPQEATSHYLVATALIKLEKYDDAITASKTFVGWLTAHAVSNGRAGCCTPCSKNCT